MSKAHLLKEIVELKSLLRPKLTLRRVITVGILVLLTLTFGREGISYVSTATRLLTQKVRSQVPVEFELERAETMVEDLDRDIKANEKEIIQEAVEVEQALKELGTADSQLKEKLRDLERTRANFSDEDYRVSSSSESQQEARLELASKLEVITIADETVAFKRQILNARRKSLDSAIAKSKNMKLKKAELELKIENIKARLKQMQSTHLAKDLSFDASKVAKIDKLLNELDAKLVVAQQTGTSVSELVDRYATRTVRPYGDVEQQVDEFLARHSAQN